MNKDSATEVAENDVDAPGEPRRGTGEHPLGANSEIARKLNEYYKSLLSEEIPDHLSELLARLEQVESEKRRK